MSSALFFLLIAWTSLSDLTVVAADDTSRLGTYYTSLNLYRSGAGTNVLSVGIGTPTQHFNLTLSTNVDYIMIAASNCSNCVDDATGYDPAASSSLTTSQTALDYTFIYPTGSTDTYQIEGEFVQEIITDARDDTNNPRPMVLVNSVQIDNPVTGSNPSGQDGSFPTGSAGIWGLGVDMSKPTRSIIPDMLTVTGAGTPSNATSFIVGFDIANYTDLPGSNAGIIHWGAVPIGAYIGDFNWLKVNTTVGGSWGIGFDYLRVGGTAVEGNGYYASIDPGFDPIYVPTKIAEQLFASVSSASRDSIDTTRWNIPCDASISMTISISGVSYVVNPATLIAARDQAGQTCWSNLVAWENGSLPEILGEIRLGTSFLNGVYSALYYSSDEMLVAIAGKPGSVNDVNLGSSSSSHANGQLAGILIGSLLAALVLIFLLCYARNHNSFQSIWYRAIRRQHRAQMNAVIRAQTLPPPIPAMLPMPMAIGLGPIPYPDVYPGGGRMTPYGLGSVPYQPVPTVGYAQQGFLPFGTSMTRGDRLPMYNAPMARMPIELDQQQGRNIGFASADPRARSGRMPPVVEPEKTGVYGPRQYVAGSSRAQQASVASPAPATALVPFFNRQGTGRARWSVPHWSARGGENVSGSGVQQRSLRFGGVGARIMRSASSASAPSRPGSEMPSHPVDPGPTAMNMRTAPRPHGIESSKKRVDDFARRYMRDEKTKRETVTNSNLSGERLPNEIGQGLERMPSTVPKERKWRVSNVLSGGGGGGEGEGMMDGQSRKGERRRVAGGGRGGGVKDRERMVERDEWLKLGWEYQ